MKIYLSDKTKPENIDLFKKQWPNAEIILKENYFVDDNDFMIDEEMNYTKEQEEAILKSGIKAQIKRVEEDKKDPNHWTNIYNK